MADDIKAFVLRMPMSLYNKVKDMAHGERCNITEFIRNRLSASTGMLPMDERISSLESKVRELMDRRKREYAYFKKRIDAVEQFIEDKTIQEDGSDA